MRRSNRRISSSAKIAYQKKNTLTTNLTDVTHIFSKVSGYDCSDPDVISGWGLDDEIPQAASKCATEEEVKSYAREVFGLPEDGSADVDM